MPKKIQIVPTFLFESISTFSSLEALQSIVLAERDLKTFNHIFDPFTFWNPLNSIFETLVKKKRGVLYNSKKTKKKVILVPSSLAKSELQKLYWYPHCEDNLRPSHVSGECHVTAVVCYTDIMPKVKFHVLVNMPYITRGWGRTTDTPFFNMPMPKAMVGP